MTQDLACIVGLPRFAGSLGRVLLVQADEQVDQLAAHRPGAQQVRQLGQVDEPRRVPGGPVIVGSVDDPVYTMVGLARLMQQVADLLQRVRHMIPPRRDDGAATRPPGHVTLVWRNGPCRSIRAAAADALRPACEYVLPDSSERAAYPAGCPGSKGRMKVRS